MRNLLLTSTRGYRSSYMLRTVFSILLALGFIAIIFYIYLFMLVDSYYGFYNAGYECSVNNRPYLCSGHPTGLYKVFISSVSDVLYIRFCIRITFSFLCSRWDILYLGSNLIANICCMNLYLNFLLEFSSLTPPPAISQWVILYHESWCYSLMNLLL